MDYEVVFCVSVTADSPEEAGRFALEDLRDPAIGPWYARVRGSEGDALQKMLDEIAPAEEVESG